MNPSHPNLRTIATHESGHAIMALLWGVSLFSKISIVKSGNSLGGIDYIQPTTEHLNKVSRSRSLEPPDIYDAIIQRIMAGPVAEAILLNKTPEYQAGTGNSDFDYIAQLVAEMRPGSSFDDVIGYIRGKEPVVRAALKRIWPVVEALAEELLDHQEVTYLEAKKVVLQAIERLPNNDKTWALKQLTG